MHGSFGLDQLQVPVPARMIVRKADCPVVDVVDAVTHRFRLSVHAVKEVGVTDLAELQQTRAQVVMIAREQQSPATRHEAANRNRIGRAQPRADIDREEP